VRVAFVMDQQVGLKTHALTLRKYIEADLEIVSTFVDVRYDAGKLSRLPGSGTAAGVREIRRGLGDVSRFDAIVWASWATKFVPDLVEATPSFLIMDMTPTQMTQMGQLYGYSARRAGFLSGWKRRATERIYQATTHFFPWNAWVGQSLIQDWAVEKEKITPLSPGVDTQLFCPAPGISQHLPLSASFAGSLRFPPSSVAPRSSDEEGDYRSSPAQRFVDTPSPARDERLAGGGGGDAGGVRFLFVGGDFTRKGGDLLLRWARETKNSVELHLVTRDPVPDAPENTFVHHGIAPLSPELVALYQGCDVFVLPTRADCYSLVSLEAMACGLPVVTSPLGGIPELVGEGESGYLVAPDDYETLSQRLDTLASDPDLRARLGAAGLARARQSFDARCLAQKLLERVKTS
jgi:glycosyltransferase involved in cell wall biosynthesis